MFRVEKEDEIQCLINGCNFLLKHLPNESFTFRLNEDDETPELKFQDLSQDEFVPYLLVNIGSGVSIIKVSLEYDSTSAKCFYYVILCPANIT